MDAVIHTLLQLLPWLQQTFLVFMEYARVNNQETLNTFSNNMIFLAKTQT